MTGVEMGDCFEIHGNFILEPGNRDWSLVHGIALGQGDIKGLWHTHAWLEKKEMVKDISNGKDVWMPTVVYYAIGNIDGVVFHYSFEEVRQKVLQHEHWGPWEPEIDKAVKRLNNHC